MICTNSTKQRKDEHHDNLLTKTINTWFAPRTPIERKDEHHDQHTKSTKIRKNEHHDHLLTKMINKWFAPRTQIKKRWTSWSLID